MAIKRDVKSEIEAAMTEAFQPDEFISYNASYGFVRGLEEVAQRLEELVEDGGQAATAASLYELFLAGAYEKAEEIDDSGGSLGMFVTDLFCGWTRARQAAAADPEETIDLLLGWMDGDDYGFCHRLERDLVKVLAPEGLGAFAERVRARLDASAPDDRGSAGYPRRQWTEVLKHILAARADAEGYLRLCKESALASADCEVLAGIHEGRGDLQEALSWVERGLALVDGERIGMSAEYDLKKRQRELLPRLGRGGEAIAAAWMDFENGPGEYTYKALMQLVPDEERVAWHDKAMAATDGGAPVSVIGLFVETDEVDRLAARIAEISDGDLEGMSHSSTLPAAEMLADPHPALAARLFRALGLRIVRAKKSKYYDAALFHFERARRCYVAAGSQQRWEVLVNAVRREHGRKYTFMPGFERVAAGGPAEEPRPSFLERASGHWPRGRGR